MAILDVKDLSFRYSADQAELLKNINFAPQPGSFNLLIGPSGSGKSTLLKLITGLYPQFGGQISQGSVLLNDQAVGPIVPFERAKHIALLFQNPTRQFAMQTPLEQLTFSLENLQLPAEEILHRVQAALEELGLWALRNRDLQTLSGGEQQRVALANILALDSDIIVLDEPFANVDPTSRLALLNHLKRLQLVNKKTIILSDHDLSGYLNIVDQVYALDNHQLITQSLDVIKAFKGANLSWSQTKPTAGPNQMTWQELTLTVGDRQLLKANAGQLSQGKLGLLTGANGIGKSTFFKALAHLKSYTGTIYFAQQASEHIKLRLWSKKVALLFQNAPDQFISLTVTQELALARKQSQAPTYWTQARLDAAVEALNLTQVLEQSVYLLSGGQQKKLQSLLMLITAPPVLLFDEPLAGLDFTSSQTLLALIKETLSQLTLTALMISHQRAGLQPFVDYELCLDQAQISYVGGNHDAL